MKNMEKPAHIYAELIGLKKLETEEKEKEENNRTNDITKEETVYDKQAKRKERWKVRK